MKRILFKIVLGLILAMLIVIQTPIAIFAGIFTGLNLILSQLGYEVRAPLFDVKLPDLTNSVKPVDPDDEALAELLKKIQKGV